MLRDSSRSTIVSSKSLSKLKNKVELAFFPRQNHQNQPQNQLLNKEKRSNSVKSFATNKVSSVDKNHIPFSTALKNTLISPALKNTLISTDRKIDKYSSKVAESNTKYREEISATKMNKPMNQLNQETLFFQNRIDNQKMVGYCWYHNDNRPLSSICKKKQNKTLRYFAIIDEKVGAKANQKRILGAIQDDTLYSGNKKYILCNSTSHNKLINLDQNQRLKLQSSHFIMIVQERIKSFVNLNRLIREAYQLIEDGVRNMDSIANVLGRSIVEKQQKYYNGTKTNQNKQVFLLIVLMESKVKRYLQQFKNGQVVNQ